MKFTVLGNNGPFPGSGEACSGYLLQEGQTNILIDCGNGVLSNLQKFINFDQLDAIILTHLHYDHMADMFVLQYAVDIMIKRGLLNRPLTVFAPPQPDEMYKKLDLPGIFELKPLNHGLKLQFGKLTLSFCEMRHPVQCFGVSVSFDDKRLVYSGDTSWHDNLIGFSKNCDLLVLDSGLLARDKTSDNVPHLTAEECGIAAREAAVKNLLLTHFWPYYNRDELLKEAKLVFSNTGLTKAMESYEL